ncbi:MAG: hypothetical protein FIB01_07320, partial [Gemmatimonadetes bacterium]|nr:hypothetical protein [Gemmatimonadota bacterium]
GGRGWGGGPGGGRGGGPGGGRGREGGPGGFEGGGLGGFDLRELLRAGANANVDSLLGAFAVNPIERVLALKDSLRFTPEQTTSVAALSDTLAAQLTLHKVALKPMVENLLTALRGRGGAGGPPGGQVMQEVQLQIQPQLQAARRETGEALRAVQRVLTDSQWVKLPQDVRRQAQANVRGGGFNAVQLIDRMLANPLPVLISLKDSLQFTADQLAQLAALSGGLQEKLNTRREQLGKRFDNVQQQEAGRIFGEIQPDIEKARKDVQDALKAAEKVLTKEQWKKVPEQVKNPYQGPGMGGPGMGGGRRGGGF